MDVRGKFIIDSEKNYRQKHNISPFSSFVEHTDHLKGNFESFISSFFPDKKICLTLSGKKAISLALGQLNLGKEDCVTIFTTSGNRYISGCVTREIEKFCNWSMKIEENTQVLFVNHEFGFPFEALKALKTQFDFPIIEDVAHGLFSQNTEKSVGTIGDFVICSFPKIFSLQIGGALLYCDKYNVQSNLTRAEIQYLNDSLLGHCLSKEEIIKKRHSNYRYLEKALGLLGAKSFFNLTELINPGVYVFTFDGFKQWDKLKIFMQSNGVESSIFYGEDAFFIPVHQNLKHLDLDYFVTLIEYFVKER
jgi:hypothetical protein